MGYCYDGPVGKASMIYNVNIAHDDEHGVYFVVSSDIPGLNIEAPTLDELVTIVKDVATDLLPAAPQEIPIELHLAFHSRHAA